MDLFPRVLHFQGGVGGKNKSILFKVLAREQVDFNFSSLLETRNVDRE